jgi:hypothetical protein
MLWDDALLHSGIPYYMSFPPTGNEAGLVGYWDFHEGSGPTIDDFTSYGHHGTLDGASWSAVTPHPYCAHCTASDSLVVHIVSTTTGSDVLTPCDSFTWLDGVTYTASNNTAPHPLTYAAGCDSIVTLILTISTSPNVVLVLDTTIYSGSTFILSAGSGFASYLWNDTGTASDLSVTVSGPYYVVLTDSIPYKGPIV